MPLSMNIWRSDGGKASAPTKAFLIEEMSLPSSAAFSIRIFRNDGVPT